MKGLVALLMLGVATPAMAQHSGHTMTMPMPAPKPKPKPAPVKKPAPAPAKKAPAKIKKPAPVKPKAAPAQTVEPAQNNDAVEEAPATDDAAMDHDMVDHGSMDTETMDGMSDEAEPTMSMVPAMTDDAAMDHGAMDHGAMDHGEMAMPAIPIAPPPPEAGNGPARAAEAFYDADAMRASRAALRREHGAQNLFWFMADRAEYQVRQGRDGYLWDLQGFYGGDIDKFWYKSEGEGSFGDKPEQAEVQALWSHAIGPWFDLQAGVRQDFTGPNRTHAVVGVQGIASYLFQIDAAAFLSSKGDLTARIEGEYEQRITQRITLQPRAEVNLAAQDISELGIGGGIDTLELGLRLRYEFAREFAPYFGISQDWKVGDSADFARARGDDPSVTSYVAGVRFWF